MEYEDRFNLLLNKHRSRAGKVYEVVSLNEAKKQHIDIRPEQKVEFSFFSSIKRYLVDTSAGVLFYTPIMAAHEYFIAGLEPVEIIYARTAGLLVHAIVMRPYGKYRTWFTKITKTTPESSKGKKLVIESLSSMSYQFPVYTTILVLAGVSFSEYIIALPIGLLIGLFMGRPFGKFLDRWRMFWGTKPTLEKDKKSK